MAAPHPRRHRATGVPGGGDGHGTHLRLSSSRGRCTPLPGGARVTRPALAEARRPGLVCGPDVVAVPRMPRHPIRPRKRPTSMRRPDLTVLAIPAFVGAMAAESLWQRRHPAEPGTTRAGDYELADTIASADHGRRQPGRAVRLGRACSTRSPRAWVATRKVLMGARRRGRGRAPRRATWSASGGARPAARPATLPARLPRRGRARRAAAGQAVPAGAACATSPPGPPGARGPAAAPSRPPR